MKLISELLVLSYYQASASMGYLVGEVIWSRQIGFAVMFAFIMYWAVWQMSRRAQKWEKIEFENWDPEEEERKKREALEWKSSVRRANKRKDFRN
tara:strand:- start:220 stop:504 length:285 start_codon:yes stop_codon:yes gene_type:complete